MSNNNFKSTKLSELLEGLLPLGSTDDAVIRGLALDSRRVSEGYLFFAIKGEHADGNHYIDDAISRGAKAIISEANQMNDYPVPYIQLSDINGAMALIADRFYGHPSRNIHLVGITGTNGKTTTSYLIHHILDYNSKKTGLIGTINYLIGNDRIRALLTTPDAVDFQRILSEMSERDITHVVTEVSSHALALKRVDRTEFDISVFTNISRDHLDFHGDMEGYYLAKRRLFLDLTGHASVINTDDHYGKRLIRELSHARMKLLSYGLSEDSGLKAFDIKEHHHGLDFAVHHGKNTSRVTSQLLGRTNVYNILAAIGVSITMGLELKTVIEAISKFKGVEGRMEPIRTGQDFLAVVDYAHTPEALRTALLALRELATGHLITVFGCGGDRDRGKRPEMGVIASDLSDTVIITTDNPRDEEPEEIISDIIKGIGKGPYSICTDRKEAIFRAVQSAGKNDVVLIAGKGHEDYQEVNGIRTPFSDKETLKEALNSIRERNTN
jgi:UDP-N-acetylmuramoyl-L-alanyl-D-glutamate--2,6-diaminopimelate ligase